ncbi:DUF6531 domain-containing protein [Aliiglaciecola aliphaticivorans]
MTSSMANIHSKTFPNFFLFIVFNLYSCLSLAEGSSTDFSDVEDLTSPEYSIEEIYANDFPSSNVSLQTGELSLSVTDMNIPGPRGMDVAIKRKYSSHYSPANTFVQFGPGWTFDFPRIKTTRLTGPGTYVPERPNCTEVDTIEIYVDGKVLGASIGMASTSDLKMNVSSTASLLIGNYILDGCSDNFIINTPDGRKISFLNGHTHYYQAGSSTGNPDYQSRQYYVDKIEDRFGNFVDFSYEYITVTSNGKTFYNVPLLNKIENSEGTEINITYIDKSTYPKVSTIAYGTTILNYSYAGTNNNYLDEFEDGENQVTSYNWSLFDPPGNFDRSIISSILLPSGAETIFSFETLDQNGSETVCSTYLPCTPCPGICYRPVVKTQVVSGVGLDTKTITYSREYETSNIITTKQESSSEKSYEFVSTFKRVTQNPTNRGSGLAATDGLLLSESIYENNVLKYTLTNDWDFLKLGEVGCTRFSIREFKNCGQSRLVNKIEKFYNSGGIDEFEIEYLSFDKYGEPLKWKESNNFNSNVRYNNVGLSHSRLLWILNRQTFHSISSTDSNYKKVSGMTYHSDSGDYKGLPNYVYKNGMLLKRFSSYHLSGSHIGVPKLIIINDTNRQIELGNYKRGQAQQFKKYLPESTGFQYAYRYVDNSGRVSQIKDYENKQCNNYSWDDASRLISISYCYGSWEPTFITYSLTSGNDGLSHIVSGMQKQIIQTGNKRSTIYYDGFYRNVLERTQDLTDSLTNTFMYHKYDAFNRNTYVSKPSNSSSAIYGTNLDYDVLSRVLLENDNTFSGSVTYEYLNQNRRKRIDNKGNEFTDKFLAFGKPYNEQLVQIIAPENTITNINYNVFENVTSITQGGISEWRVYDSKQRLCKIVRPDSGATGFLHNNIGLVITKASGNSVSTSNSSCDTSFSSSQRIDYTYNNHGQIKTIDYGDSSLDKTFVYDRDKRLVKIVTDRTENNYSYNQVGLLSAESMTVDDRLFQFVYGYDDLKNLSSIIYPDSELVTFSPNALGQSTNVGAYVTDASYHANGSIKQFEYGNGFIHSQLQYNSGLPKDFTDLKGATVAIDQYFEYDANGNMKFLRNDQNRTYDIALIYDDLDRIKTISDSFKGAGLVDYDEMGNIENYNIGSQSITYHYDTNKKLISTSGSHINNFSYDDRGNVKNNGSITFNYNLAGHTTSLTKSGQTSSFLYDGNDKRIIKYADGDSQYFLYGLDGTLLYQQDQSTYINHVYLDKRQVAEKSGVLSTTPPSGITSIIIDGASQNLYSSSQTAILFSQNLDNDTAAPMQWNAGGSSLKIEYKVDFGTSGNSSNYEDTDWLHKYTYLPNESTGSISFTSHLPYSGLSGSKVGAYPYNSSSSYYNPNNYAKLHYRFRTEGPNGSSSWRYLKPIWIYYND